MDGIATFTIVASSRIMNAPASTTAREIQRRGSRVSSRAPQFVMASVRRADDSLASSLMTHHRGSALAVRHQFRQTGQKLVVPGDFGLQAKNLVPESHVLQATQLLVGSFLELLPRDHLRRIGLTAGGEKGPHRVLGKVRQVVQRKVDRVAWAPGVSERFV